MQPSSLLARAIERGLHEEGMTVHRADDLLHAKMLAAEGRHDVIVLDVPVHIEVATLQHWRRCGITAPVLFLSVPGSRSNRFDELGIGPAATLVKPFLFADLLAELQRLAELHGAAEPCLFPASVSPTCALQEV
jgi:two-component system OmpR family response regulator